MTVLIFEDNLLWSVRLRKSVEALGHDAVILSRRDASVPDADVALINVSSASFDLAQLVPALRERGVRTIGHAGHKEKSLHEQGRELGLDVMATNSQITFRLADLLRETSAPFHQS